MEDEIESKIQTDSQKSEEKPSNKKRYIIFSALIAFLALYVYLSWLNIQKNYKNTHNPTKNGNIDSKTGSSSPDTQVTKYFPPSSSSTSPTLTVKPIYSDQDYVVFAHYLQGYTIDYPAKDIDAHLVGATSGNFKKDFSDGSSILIYQIRPENPISEIDFNNIFTQLTVCDMGDCYNFFENIQYEKLLEKKMTTLNGMGAFWIKTSEKLGYVNESADSLGEPVTVERYLIPQKDTFLIIEITYKDSVSNDLSRTLSTFRIIPSIPESWITYENSQYNEIKFKHPENYRIVENNQEKRIGITSSEGIINLYYFDKNDELGSYINSIGDFAPRKGGVGYSSIYEAENYLGNDVEQLKFSLNAFTFIQGGNHAIRVYDPSHKRVTVYFYTYTTDTLKFFRVTSPESMEMVMNQILMSMNQLMK